MAYLDKRQELDSAQDADRTAYVYSEKLWEDIDLQDDSPSKSSACKCQNPFCETHSLDRDDLTQEWAALEQHPQQSEKPIPSLHNPPVEQPSEVDSRPAPPQIMTRTIDRPLMTENSPLSSVQLSTTPRTSTLYQNRRTRTRDNLLLLSIAPPPQCTSPSCPLNNPLYNIEHSQGPYVHNGQSLGLILAGQVSKYVGSVLDDFGGSLPPLGIWKAYDRLVKRKGEGDDEEIVVGFLRSHCEGQARGRLLKKLGRE